MANRREESNISQSAINDVNVEGNLTIEKINQIVNLSDDDKYKYIESLKFEYRGKINETKNTYRDAVRSLLKYLRQELRKLYRETENEINEKRDEIHRLEKEERIRKEVRQRYAKEKERLRKEGSDEELSITEFITNEELAELGWSESFHTMFLLADPRLELMERAASFLDGRKNPIEEAKDYLEALEEDLEELKETLESVSRFSKVDPANLHIDRIIQVDNFSGLNSIEELKRKYESEYQKTTEEYSLKEAALAKERDLKIYKFQLVRYLHEDGFPLRQENSDILEDFLHGSVLCNDDIEEAGNQAARIFCQKSLDSYEQIYSIKLSADGFPLSQESLNELDKLKESLGLTSLSFIKAEISSIEIRQIQPYFRNKVRLYLELYQQKLEEYS